MLQMQSPSQQLRSATTSCSLCAVCHAQQCDATAQCGLTFCIVHAADLGCFPVRLDSLLVQCPYLRAVAVVGVVSVESAANQHGRRLG